MSVWTVALTLLGCVRVVAARRLRHGALDRLQAAFARADCGSALLEDHVQLAALAVGAVLVLGGQVLVGRLLGELRDVALSEAFGDLGDGWGHENRQQRHREVADCQGQGLRAFELGGVHLEGAGDLLLVGLQLGEVVVC
eukprot:12928526-Alexandrium_andersonii.AAC.1